MSRSSFRMLWRYALVGSLVAGIYLILFHALKQRMSSSTAASALAFAIATATQYVCHGRYTFGRSLGNADQAARFVTTVAVGFAFATACVGLIGPALGVSDVWSSVAVVVILPVFNLVMFAFWVFVLRRPSVGTADSK